MRIPRPIKFMVGCAAWWADALLQTFTPVEKLPSIDEMAEQLAAAEAEQEVSEPRDSAQDSVDDLRGSFWCYEHELVTEECGCEPDKAQTDWFLDAAEAGKIPDGPPFMFIEANREPPLTDDEIIAVRQLIEERFPITPTSPAANVEKPAPQQENAPRRPPPPPASGGAGHPNLTWRTRMFAAAHGLRQYTATRECDAPNYYRSLADLIVADLGSDEQLQTHK